MDHDGQFQLSDVRSLLESLDPEAVFSPCTGWDCISDACMKPEVIVELTRKLQHVKQSSFYTEWISGLFNQILRQACINAKFPMFPTARRTKVGRLDKFSLCWLSRVKRDPPAIAKTSQPVQEPSEIPSRSPVSPLLPDPDGVPSPSDVGSYHEPSHVALPITDGDPNGAAQHRFFDEFRSAVCRDFENCGLAQNAFGDRCAELLDKTGTLHSNGWGWEWNSASPTCDISLLS